MDSAINKAYERLNFVTQDKEFLRNYHFKINPGTTSCSGKNPVLEFKNNP